MEKINILKPTHDQPRELDLSKKSTVSWTLGAQSQTEAQEAQTDLCRNSRDESIRDEGRTAGVSQKLGFAESHLSVLLSSLLLSSTL